MGVIGSPGGSAGGVAPASSDRFILYLFNARDVNMLFVGLT